MDRRRYFRYTFPVADRPSVRLECLDWPTPLIGAVVDISAGGLLVHTPKWTTPFAARQAVMVHCQLPHGGPNLLLASEIVHSRTQADGVYCGVHFVPAEPASAQKARESMMLRFIAEEQRRHLREHLAPTTPPDLGGSQ